MSLSIKDILDLEVMKDAELLVKGDSFEEPVSGITIMEAPDISKWVAKGYVILSNLYSLSGHEDSMDSFVSELKESKVAGMIVKTRYDKVDIVVVRENTEDLYAGIERQVDENTAESIKRITRNASERIAKFAFVYAVKNNRKEVCVVTKANICKLSDGLFLESARKIASDFPQIKFREILVDNCCMQLVQNPNQFDVLLLPNLYGDIVSDLCAGLVGGLGIAQGANIGSDYAVFEPVHGSAPDIAGEDKANPTALLMSAIEMLNYIGEIEAAKRIKFALFETLNADVKTVDLGGSAKCSEFTQAVIDRISVLNSAVS